MGAYINRDTTEEKIAFCEEFGTKVENWEDIFDDPSKWYTNNLILPTAAAVGRI